MSKPGKDTSLFFQILLLVLNVLAIVILTGLAWFFEWIGPEFTAGFAVGLFFVLTVWRYQEYFSDPPAGSDRAR